MTGIPPSQSHVAFRVRRYDASDYDALFDIQRACFPPPYPEEQLWSPAQVEAHARVFPEGALCVENAGGRIVASCTSLIVDSREAHDAQGKSNAHTWAAVSGDGFLTTHRARGDTLYGIDMAVHPAWRRLGLARLLYQARILMVMELGLQSFQAAGRMSGYAAVKQAVTPEEYAADVVGGTREDSVLTAQLRSGLTPLKVLHDYISDEESGDCALLLEWKNPQWNR